MEIKKRFLQKYLHDIAVEQIGEEYKEKGYSISTEEKVGNKYKADLIARKGNETIVFEVKSGKMSKDRKEQIKLLANYVREQGNYKFHVILATPPKEKKLEITDVVALLTDNIINDFPSELDELSTHTRLEEVSDIDIDEILIDGNSIFVSGDGVVNVQLQVGSDGDQARGDGLISYDGFPFNFEMTLAYDDDFKLKIADVGNLKVDTSSFYE